MKPDLKKLRKKLDKIDEEIIRDISLRMKIVHQIAFVKALHGIKIKDKKREKELFEHIAETARVYHLSPLFAEKIFSMILQESYREQKEFLRFYSNDKENLNGKR